MNHIVVILYLIIEVYAGKKAVIKLNDKNGKKKINSMSLIS